MTGTDEIKVLVTDVEWSSYANWSLTLEVRLRPYYNSDERESYLTQLTVFFNASFDVGGSWCPAHLTRADLYDSSSDDTDSGDSDEDDDATSDSEDTNC